MLYDVVDFSGAPLLTGTLADCAAFAACRLDASTREHQALGALHLANAMTLPSEIVGSMAVAQLLGPDGAA